MNIANRAFSLVRSEAIAALNVTVEEYEHVSGAKHFHFASEHQENVFLVAFRTMPTDSTGVAHVLEHTVLCGSERYPVRDPFFTMLRRSLNTFMNAFTGNDYTAYPFASQNRKDYFNLMDVYLDAVFFSRLDPLDFSQEGHRVEYADSNDPASPLEYKGVVYNEMKGDTSSPMSMLYQAIQEKLYPTSTYHFNSGGDPKNIPDLSYEQLLAFYRTHYHPSNAIFMTFGDIPAEQQQQKMIDLALSKFDAEPQSLIAVSEEPRYKMPVSSNETYPVDDDDLSKKTHIVLAWLLGRNTELRQLLRCHLLSDVLLDTSASPLRKALEQAEFATSASPMCGFEEDHMETNFMCGVEGSEPEHADQVEALVLEVLNKVADEGVPQKDLEAVLHQLELSQREIGGDGSPYGLQLMFSCLPAAIHRGDPIALLNLDSELVALRKEIANPKFIKNLVRELLLDNPHRVRVVMQPDRNQGAAIISEEQTRLRQHASKLSAEQKSDLIDLATTLKQRQEETEDLSILPKVGVLDIPSSKSFPNASASSIAGTNGITYHQLIRDLPALDVTQLELLPLYNSVVTELGSGGRSYLETQQLQHAMTGGISAFSTIRSLPDDYNLYRGFSTLSSRTLNAKARPMVELVRDTAQQPRFDELDRLQELVQQLATGRQNSVSGNGHQYAMAAASARFRPVSAVNNLLTGIPGVLRMKALMKEVQDLGSVKVLGEKLQSIHDLLLKCRHQTLLVADENYLEAISVAVSDIWKPEPTSDSRGFKVPAIEPSEDMAFVVTTQVNYCASAFPTVSESHEDSASLAILAGVLRNNFLHSELREKGGAYGGGASYDTSNGVFRFYSYRDPRLAETFTTFDQSVQWALSTDITDEMLEEAVMGLVSSIDSPGSPAGEICQAFHLSLFGRDAQYREAMRAQYLAVRSADLLKVTEKYLQSVPAKAVVTSENRLSEIDTSFAVLNINEQS